MQRYGWTLVVGMIFNFAGAQVSAFEQPYVPRSFVSTPGVEELSGRMIVRPRQELAGEAVAKGDPGARLNRELVLSQIGHLIVRRFEMTDDFVINLPTQTTETEFADVLMQTGLYEYAEPDWIVYPCATPNDPFFSLQPHHTVISSQRAWDLTSSLGSDADVIVAFTDTGVRLDHPDLMPNLVPGYDVITHLAQADGGNVSDVSGHGTNVAGIIAAKGNNGVGIAGVGWNLKLMPIRVSASDTGATQLSNVLEGIQWASTHGAKVINTSYSGVENESVETTAAAARALGCINVWGAGNDNRNTNRMRDPNNVQEWDHRSVIVVGGTDQNDAKWSGSNYGRGVDVFAPAVGIFSTKRTNTGANGPYALLVPGTSWSCAIVSGICGLVWAASPSSTPEQVEFRVFRTCLDLDGNRDPLNVLYRPGNDFYWGWGRTNSARSVDPPQIRYDLVQLPLLSGETEGGAYGINDYGQIVGFCGAGQALRPVRWDNDSISLLPTLSSGYGWATDINNNGSIVINSGTNRTTACQVGRFSSGVVEWLPEALSIGFSGSRGRRINELGHISVTLFTANASPFPAIWKQSSIVDISSVTGVTFGTCYGINDSGWTSGFANGGSTYYNIQLYNYESNEVIVQPGPSGATDLYDISNSNVSVGYYSSASVERALKVEISASGGAILSGLGTGSRSNGSASAVNDHEEIVGTSYNNPWPSSVSAEIWEAGFVQEFGHGSLMSKVRNANGFTSLKQAEAINNHGQIVGLGSVGAFTRPFLANPVDAGVQSNYDLGQIGSGPIIGAILPNTMKLDFISANTNEVLASVRAPYNKVDGSVRYPLPAQLNGESFHVYVRPCGEDYDATNQDLGPGYLGKMYPPLGEQPLPPDTSYIEQLDLVPGDVDYDNEVTLIDFSIVSYAFGSAYGDPNYVHAANLDGDTDNEITLVDIGILAANFGQTGDDDPTP